VTMLAKRMIEIILKGFMILIFCGYELICD